MPVSLWSFEMGGGHGTNQRTHSAARRISAHLESSDPEDGIHRDHRSGLPKKLGKRGWQSQEAIEQAIDAILKRDQTWEFLSYRVIGTVENTKRYQGRGRPRPEAPYEEVTRSRWAVEYHWREEEINKAELLGGYVPLITNDAELTTQQTLTAYKEQYQPELRFKWLKGAGIFAPVLLKTPKRIEAFFFVVGLVLQLFTLIERQAARQITQRGEPVRGLKPNNLKDSRPKTEAILEAFRKVTVTHVVFADQSAEVVLSPLSPLQRCLLQV
ncbi:MAG: hypothetical protein HY731_04950 [Candidatus Tectomicrobia bacterium]|nr:hypothetical protein [Candidatus Tectomicrobia bacterium]